MKINPISIMIICVLLFFSCSSSPKKPVEIDVLRKQSEAGIDLGNKAASQGQYNNAILLLAEAKRKAVLADDYSLIIRTSLSLGNVYLLADKTSDAFNELDAALAEAQRIQNAEFISICGIFRARALLLSERETTENVLEFIIREQANIKDRYYTALSWQTRGLALRSMGAYSEAEEALKQSLDIHLKDRYLEYASYDWYTIASVRSLSRNYNGAVLALEESMSIDRRIENSWGLISSWKAMGDVLVKMGRTEDAKAAYERAEAILKAMP